MSKKKNRDSEVVKLAKGKQTDCSRCGAWTRLCAHHIHSLVNGGKDELSNIDILCARCHREWHYSWEDKCDYSSFLDTVPTRVWPVLSHYGSESTTMELINRAWLEFRDIVRSGGTEIPENDTKELVTILVMNAFVILEQGKIIQGPQLQKQLDGIAKAKSEGKYKGRAPTARSKSSEITKLWHDGFSVLNISSLTGISRASVYRIINDHKSTWQDSPPFKVILMECSS